jgi:hypothetical protein
LKRFVFSLQFLQPSFFCTWSSFTLVE